MAQNDLERSSKELYFTMFEKGAEKEAKADYIFSQGCKELSSEVMVMDAEGIPVNRRQGRVRG